MYRGSDSKGLCSVSTKYTSVMSFICRLEPRTPAAAPQTSPTEKHDTSPYPPPANMHRLCRNRVGATPRAASRESPAGSGGTGGGRPRSRKALLVLQVQTGLLEEKGLRGAAGAADGERLGEVGRACVRRGSSASVMAALAGAQPSLPPRTDHRRWGCSQPLMPSDAG